MASSVLKEKKVKLCEISDQELVSEYTKVVRISWGERKGLRHHHDHDPSYQRELSVKRELLRRLEQRSVQKVAK